VRDRIEVALPSDSAYQAHAAYCEPELVAHGKTDARVAHVERRKPHAIAGSTPVAVGANSRRQMDLPKTLTSTKGFGRVRET